MKLRRWLIIGSIIFLSFSVKGTEQPNIILLLVDDAGYADFGFQGSRHFRTPHLDQLAKAGVRLTQFNMTAAVCGASRAGLLTGRYQQCFGFEENNVPPLMSPNGKLTGDEMGLPREIPTIGNYLQELGYRTAIFGKWHLGIADRYHPLKRGFDEFYGLRGGARSFFAYPNPEKAKRENLMERNFKHYEEPAGYLTDVLADAACNFIERSNGAPFFAYVAFNAVHLPLQVAPEDKNEFTQLKEKRRKVAQITLALDRACDRIINKLKEIGRYDNTLIFFTNDKGDPSDKNALSNWPLSGVKATHLEGGIRVPGLIVWSGKLKAGTVYNYPLCALDLLPTFVKAAGGNPESISGLDGVDIIPFLQSKKEERPHQTLYWKIDRHGTVRDGDWKLLRMPDRPAQLFNIVEDPGEQHDLADVYPDKVKALYKNYLPGNRHWNVRCLCCGGRKRAGRPNDLTSFENRRRHHSDRCFSQIHFSNHWKNKMLWIRRV